MIIATLKISPALIKKVHDNKIEKKNYNLIKMEKLKEVMHVDDLARACVFFAEKNNT